MKKLFLLITISTVLFSCKKGGSDKFLNGQLTGLNNEPVYLISGTSNNATIDTVKVRKGGFTVDQAPEDARMITLILPQNHSVTFYANDESKLTISGDINSPFSIRIVGDSVNDRLTKYRETASAEIEALYKLQQQAGKAWKTDSLKHYEELLYSPKAKALRKALKQKTVEFITEQNASPAAVLAIRDYLYLTEDFGSLKEILAKVRGSEMKDFSPLHELKLASKQILKPGSTILSFQACNTDNKQEYFYTGTGKKMILLFWKSDDKYSAYLNKKLSAGFEKANKDSVTFTAISLDESYEDWKAAIKKGNYKGKQLLVRGGFQNENISKAGINRTPCLLNISKTGTLTAICENNENPLK